jgi:hypothetical protein
MKKYLDPDFVIPFLVYCVIQPGIMIVAVSVFVYALWNY